MIALGLPAVLGLLALSEPISNPVFTKFAISMTKTRPAPSIRSESRPRPSGLEDSLYLFGPGLEWHEIVERLGPWLGRPIPRSANRGAYATTEELISAVREGRGQCSTWTEALISLFRSAQRQCREWGNIAYGKLHQTGHALIDVWLPDQQQWAMLDAFLGFWPRGVDGHPMRTTEFRQVMLTSPENAEIVPLNGRSPRRADIMRYYADPNLRLVELVRNDPVLVSEHWTRHVERVNRPLGQLLQWGAGISSLYLVPDSPEYEELRRDLLRVRRKSFLGLLLLCATAIVAVAMIVPWQRRGLDQ